MICPKCSEEIADKSKFCPECGAALRALAVPDQRTKMADPERRPSFDHRADRPSSKPTVTRRPVEEIVDADYRIVESGDGTRHKVPAGGGLLVIYAGEHLKERLVLVMTTFAYPGTGDYQNRRALYVFVPKRLLGETTPVPPLLKDWEFADGEGMYRRPDELNLFRRFHKVFRVKPQRFGGFTLHGFQVPVQPGLYQVVLLSIDSSGGTDERDWEMQSPDLMVEEGEITEFTVRGLR